MMEVIGKRMPISFQTADCLGQPFVIFLDLKLVARLVVFCLSPGLLVLYKRSLFCTRYISSHLLDPFYVSRAMCS